MVRLDENFQKSWHHVWTKFQKILLICLDRSRHTQKISNFARMAHQATKKSKFIWTSQSGLQKWQFCLDQPQKIAILLPDGVSAN